jgi:hypothetical protein
MGCNGNSLHNRDGERHMLGYSRLIERWRYRFLLTVLLATILLQPLLNDLRIGQAILVLAYGAIMAGGVYATLDIDPLLGSHARFGGP